MADLFQWGFLTITVQGSVDDAGLEVKQGIRTFRAQLATLRHVYVRRTGGGVYEEMVVGLEPTPGKNKVLRFSANAGQPGFHAFLQAVLARRPDIDRRALDEKTAMKMIGAKNVELITAAVVMLILPLILGIVLLPKLIHGLDGGHEKVKLAKLVKGYAPSTSNLTITNAKVDTSNTLSLTTVSKRNGVETGRSTKFYIPLVEPDADEDEPIKVILETPKLADSQLAELEDSTSIKGMARDVMWEGLASSQRDWFVDKAHRKLAKDVLLVEYKAEPGGELTVFLVALGVTTVLMAIVGVIVVVKQRKG